MQYKELNEKLKAALIKIKKNKYYIKYGWVLKYLIIFKIIKWLVIAYIVYQKFKK